MVSYYSIVSQTLGNDIIMDTSIDTYLWQFYSALVLDALRGSTSCILPQFKAPLILSQCDCGYNIEGCFILVFNREKVSQLYPGSAQITSLLLFTRFSVMKALSYTSCQQQTDKELLHT